MYGSITWNVTYVRGSVMEIKNITISGSDETMVRKQLVIVSTRIGWRNTKIIETYNTFKQAV